LAATLSLDPDNRIGPVRPRLFGSFVEHLGRCVYGGVFEPEHALADGHGFRTDVLELVRELGVTLVRYPGGNFVSGYRWEDGTGPMDRRPTRLDTAWHSVEPNTFGIGEFVEWARTARVEPMLALNLGTRGVAEALDLLEYGNHPAGTHLSDLRVSHGHDQPFDIRLWCLGNELDGPWQLGHKTADEYGRLAAETARAMRMVDPNLELVACGSSFAEMPTFGEWEQTVLGHTYDQVDYISLHAYYEERDGDLGGFLASSLRMDSFIDRVISIADGVAARLGSTKRIDLSFDEWNVWYVSGFLEEGPSADWLRAPHLIEDTYNVADAVVVGSLLMALLRHADRVAAACQAQLVNAIAPIRTQTGGPAWRQTIFHPFAQTARHARGDVLIPDVQCPHYESAPHGDTPLIDAVATHDHETGETAVFVVNRSIDDAVLLSVDTSAFTTYEVVEHTVLADDDIRAVNTMESPDRIVPRPGARPQSTDRGVDIVLPPVSWNMLRLRSLDHARR
jgi:alpha-N-arabinofuranosidase